MLKEKFRLSGKELASVNGGALLNDAHDNAVIVIYLYKVGQGFNKEQVKEALEADYRSDPSIFSTNGSEEDLQELLRMADEIYDQIDELI